MKKRTERRSAETPVDALFTRKLSDTSLPLTAGSYQRLQARLDHRASARPVTMWRTPALRYGAVAACLLLIGTAGWLYNKAVVQQPGVAVNSTKRVLPKQSVKEAPEAGPVNPKAAEPMLNLNRAVAAQVPPRTQPAAKNGNPVDTYRNDRLVATQPVDTDRQPDAPATALRTEEHTMDKLAGSGPPAERVLVVTIAEPEALVAARQAAQRVENQKNVAIAAAQPVNETKATVVWQRIKQLKQGEIMARRTGADDERNLLNRAYNGLRQSLEKEKPAKQ